MRSAHAAKYVQDAVDDVCHAGWMPITLYVAFTTHKIRTIAYEEVVDGVGG